MAAVLMPYVSKAQAAKFHSTPSLQKYAPEFDAATNFADLPARVVPKATKRKKAKHSRRTALTRMLMHTKSVHR